LTTEKREVRRGLARSMSRPRACVEAPCTRTGRPCDCPGRWRSGSRWEVRGRHPPMHGRRESDRPV